MYENLSSMSLFTDDFLPRIFGVCSEADTFASYEVLGIAKIACVEERACIGVLDDACDNIGAFRLCKKGFVSPSASCVYQKKEYTGKYIRGAAGQKFLGLNVSHMKICLYINIRSRHKWIHMHRRQFVCDNYN